MRFTRENGGYRLARCGGASRKRLLQVGDRTGHAITKALREAFEAGGAHELPEPPLAALEPTAGRLARDVRVKDGESRRSTPAPSCWRPADAASPRPKARGELSRTTRTRPAR